MKETAAESAALKTKFKQHFNDYGYGSEMPEELKKASREFPLEYSEACQEWEIDHLEELE